MAERSPVFLSLTQPPKWMGLPILYGAVWMFGSALIFLWVQSFWVALIALAAYPVLWKAADWDPHFIDVVVTTIRETPFTRNRGKHGGDSYAP